MTAINMFKTLLVSCFLVMDLSNLTYASDSGPMEFLVDVNLWSTFIRDMAQYTGSSCIYLVTDSTKSVFTKMKKVVSQIPKLHSAPNFRPIWFRFLSSKNSTFIKESIQSDLKGPMLVILKCNQKIVSSVLKKVMHDTNMLNKISWIVEYSEAAKWFNNLNQEIIFSPSIRLFVISIQHLKGLNKRGTKVIIQYAYSDYKMEIARMAIMGYWQPESGLRKIVLFSECCYNLNGYTIKLGYAKGDEPFATVEKIGSKFILTGSVGHLLKIILKHLGIRIVKIKSEPNGTFGGLDRNNTPTGLFKLLANNQADIILNPVSYSLDRYKVADLTVSVFENNIVGIYKPLDDNSKFWKFYARPFSMYSWIIILTIFPCLMMISMIFMRYFPNTGVTDSNQFDILVIFGLLLNQGSSQCPTSVGWRIYHWSIMLLGTLLVAFYSSKIVAEYAVLKHREFFTDFYEVADHPIYRPIVWKDSSIHHMLKDSAEPEASTLWNRMKKDINKYTVTSIEETIEQVDCCHGVYISSSVYIKILKNKNPSFVILDRSLGKESIGIALQKNSPLTKLFDTVLNHLHEGGIIQNLIDVHHNNSSNIKETKIVKPIALSKMIFPITFIANAIVFTIILCVIENIWVKYKVAKLFMK